MGLLEQGGTPSASDSVYCLAELNNMWPSWGIDEGLIFAEVPFSGNLSTTVASYTIGTGATFSTQRPSRVYKAFYVLGNNRNELEIVPAGKYFEHNDLAATAATPDQLYPDYNVDPTTGFATLYLWPVPTFGSGAPTLQMLLAVPFAAWALAVAYNIPQGFQDALEWSLAFRCLPGFGEAVNANVAQVIGMEATKAEARLRKMNAFNRQMPEVPAPGTPAQQEA